ncbi:hybrid sensor histidine kinase/response regulator [Mangrovicella endophytica]|uniref:hybrid sensor histidine kinase/response regulator n=1 Tax=Mangrovicella endophytica TaxID=2066697 RepID=UPI000C9E048C|nr:hybrid sensor histidine kinase/response regulator [Mangrovicella endophytica]
MKIAGDKVRNALPTILLAVTLLITGIMITWYTAMVLRRHDEQFQQELKLYQGAIRLQADTVIVRIKDAAAFIASGAEEEIPAKLKISIRKSPHVVELGYFKSGEPGLVHGLVGKSTSFDTSRRDELQRFVAFLKETEGLVVTVTPSDWPHLFHSISDGRAVMVQALRTSTASGDFNVVYAVMDLKGVVQESAEQVIRGHLEEVRFQTGKEGVIWDFDHSYSVLDRIIRPAPTTISVPVTRNLDMMVDVRKSYERMSALFVMLGGLLAIALMSGALVFFYQRLRHRSEAELIAALADSRRSSEAKSIFLANMSHEIRTPLNGVLGMAELLGRTELTEAQRRYADQIKSSGSMLLAILNDILDISKIESRQLAIDPVRTRLPSLIGDIVSFYSAGAQNKGIELLLDVDPTLPEQVEVDPTRLRQIIGNLLGNALKFTRDGEVTVTVKVLAFDEETQHCVVDFAVKDTGIGIAAQNIAKLFSRFSQAEESTTRLYGGTGLGLAICKEICELMGGEIRVSSEEGKGSTFSFSLAMKVVEPASETPLAPLHVALVTCSSSLAEILDRGLGARQIHCVTFRPTGNFAEAIEKAQAASGPFDLLVTDQGKHINAALAVQCLVHARPGLAGLPTIILGSQQVNMRYNEFDQAVVKPFDSRVLADSIRRLVGSRDSNAMADESIGAEAPDLLPYNGMKALLVDDNNVNLLFGEEVLQGLGFTVSTATNGAKAVDAAQDGDYDVIFMDCQMPIMDGYQATGAIRRLMEDKIVRRVPIIAVTANALKGDREKCLEAGMDAFVTKPMSVSHLEEVLVSLLKAPAVAAPKRAPRRAANNDQQRSTTMSTPPSALPSISLPVTQPAAAIPQAAAVPLQANLVPPATERPKIPLIDVIAFKQTRAAMTRFDTLVSLYRTDTAEYLRLIREALEFDRIDEAVMPAHTIKSSSRILGAMGLASLAEDFEKRARTDGAAQTKELQALRIHMDRIFQLTIEGIDRLMQEGQMARSA